jgi:hypothetical protein
VGLACAGYRKLDALGIKPGMAARCAAWCATLVYLRLLLIAVLVVWLGTVLLACLLELVAQSRGGTKAMPNIAETLWQVY